MSLAASAQLGCADSDSGKPGTPLPPSSLRIDATLATFLPIPVGMMRDVAVDKDGYVYVAGGTPEQSFVPTVGPGHGGGDMDAIIFKLDPNGDVVWSRLVGGPQHDRAYAIETDPLGNVYIAGRAGDQFPTTPGAFQETFQGNDPSDLNRRYGPQDGFVAKLAPDGQTLWATYVGTDGQEFFRDIDVDANGQVHGCLRIGRPVSFISANAYQTRVPTGLSCVLVKLAADGASLDWATYFSPTDSANSGGTPSVRVDDRDGTVVVSATVLSGAMPVTPGAVQPTNAGAPDMHVARFSADGRDLLFGTYIGGSDAEFGDTHNLEVDADGSVVLAATTKSSDFPYASGGFQTAYGGSGGDLNQIGDGFIVRLSADGTRVLAGTFLGGRSGEGLEGVAIDGAGNIFVSGGTHSNDFPVTSNAYQTTQRAPASVFATLLSPDLDALLYSTLWSGSRDDLGLAATRGGDRLYVTGISTSTDLPETNTIPGPRGGDYTPYLPPGETDPLRAGYGYPIIFELEAF